MREVWSVDAQTASTESVAFMFYNPAVRRSDPAPAEFTDVHQALLSDPCFISQATAHVLFETHLKYTLRGETKVQS